MLLTQWEFAILNDKHDNPDELRCIGHDITPLILKQQKLRSLVDIAAEHNNRLVNFIYIIYHNIRFKVANILRILDINEQLEHYKVAPDLINENTISLNECGRSVKS
ncbi:hypothetical protein [Dyadobacter psychrotolerans]|uniref:Uncharacterized protein n=1 Tax=Dyadobacter psychrotolerans TaxID=2541721 RepID=A0A4R5DLR0_9BACT|nr:hypothetical protein [Dyadobacter psychrotolerans]TDE15186.1 hypothetical protein E0F88_11720 [Dyadobacter psychrotolerans]